MKCPVCLEPDLLLADRQGIDYCPKCRGVWLDRGELDKLIERSSSQGSLGGTGTSRSGDRDSHRSHDEYRDDDYREGGYKRKRRGFLGELFDFD